MEKVFAGLLVTLGVMALVAVIAIVGGTFVFWLWPVAVPAVLPGLVTAGTIAGKLTWWQSVCLTWLCGLLIKSSQTNNNNS